MGYSVFKLAFAGTIFAAACAFVFTASPVKAAWTLPATPCDQAQIDFQISGVNQHLNDTSQREDGTRAFDYGTASQPFVSADASGVIIFNFQTLFTAPTSTVSYVKLLGFAADCGPIFGLGPAFTNPTSPSSHVLTYADNGHTVTLDGQTQIQNPSGTARYIWIEAWDGVSGSAAASYSYLVDLQDIQNPTNDTQPPEPQGPRPVLIVPGILGTELWNGDDLVWPDLLEMFLDINDQFLVENLSLQERGYSVNLINASSTIEKILNIPKVDINVFEALRLDLEASDYVKNENLFYFPYDWRLDLNLFKEELGEKIEAIKSQAGADSVDIIAHSMGGLLVKSYLQSYGPESIDKIVFIGTPHLGAPKAAKVLLEGDRFSIPWLEEDRMRDLALNFPTIYELLPDEEYFQTFQGYIKEFQFFGNPPLLDYASTRGFLIAKKQKNGALYDIAQLFKASIQDTDFSDIKVYNIAGCKSSTQVAYQLSAFGNIGRVAYLSGDGTVPLVSSDAVNIPTLHKYYVKNANHSELPSTDGVKELILDILAEQAPVLAGNMSGSPDFCNFKGKTLSWYSPVEVHIYSQGLHTGPIKNNGIEYGIPGVDYEIINGEKFIFLPTDEGQEYDIQAIGETAGTFDLLISENNDGLTGNTFVYDDVPITTGTPIAFPISETSVNSTIVVNEQVLPADSQIPGEQAGDMIPPEIAISYDQSADEFAFAAVDNLDPNPSIEYADGICTASDHTGNQTVMTYSLVDKKINNWLSVKSITYNHGTSITPLQNTFHVQFREKREQLRDFDQFIKIKQDERARVNYQKRRNQSVVTHKLKGEKRTREVFPGFKYLELETNQGNLEINIK